MTGFGCKRSSSHVITVPQAIRAYSVTVAKLEGNEEALTYVDPLDPYTAHIGIRQWFNKVFHPDNQDWVNTTPVKEQVRLRR